MKDMKEIVFTGIDIVAAAKQRDLVAQTYEIFSNSFYDIVTEYINNGLSNYWKSKNAVDFGNKMNAISEKFDSMIYNKCNALVNCIEHAIKRYCTIFNHECSVGNYEINTASGFSFNNVFEETKDNISGMNIKPALECIELFKKEMLTLADEMNTALSNIHISLFDEVNDQQTAFNQIIAAIKDDFVTYVDAIVRLVEEATKKEADNILLAKQQTTTEFNQTA